MTKTVPKVVRIISKPIQIEEFEVYPDHNKSEQPTIKSIFKMTISKEEILDSELYFMKSKLPQEWDDLKNIYYIRQSRTRLRYTRTFIYNNPLLNNNNTFFSKFFHKFGKIINDFCSYVKPSPEL